MNEKIYCSDCMYLKSYYEYTIPIDWDCDHDSNKEEIFVKSWHSKYSYIKYIRKPKTLNRNNRCLKFKHCNTTST